VDGKFISYLFKLPKTIHLFYRYSQGLTSDTWDLKFRHFQEIKVTIPGIDEQQAIAQVFMTCDKELSLLRKKLAAFQKQKRGLMQKLLTGQWRVKAPESQ
jgi:type I restriction enzyme, S subunit